MKITPLTSLVNGSATGAAVSVGSGTDANMAVTAMLIPTSFAGTAITFTGSVDGTNFYAIKKSDGTDLSYTVAAGTMVNVAAADLASYPFFKPVSNASETNKTITFMCRPVA